MDQQPPGHSPGKTKPPTPPAPYVSLQSSLQKHHRVELIYPCLDRKRKRNGPLLPDPVRLPERYKPTPLINTLASEAHSSYGSAEEWRMFSYTSQVSEADARWTDDMVALDDFKFKSEYEEFREVMNLINSRVGETTLKILTYRSTGHGRKPQRRKIRVHMSSLVYLAEPDDAKRDTISLSRTFSFPLADFVNDDVYKVHDWVSNFCDLMGRVTDRAVKHIAHQIRAQEEEDYDYEWLPERQLHLETALERYTQPSTTKPETKPAAEEPSICAICRGDLAEVESSALTLRCKHTFCKDCALPWFQQSGPASSNCPLCRAPIFTDKGHVKQIPHGLDDNSHYLPDDRYNAWENFERSCADLDSHRAENLESYMSTSQRNICDCIEQLLHGAAFESGESTRLELQPQHFPETRIALRSLKKGTTIVARKPLRKMRTVFETLVNMMWRGLTAEMRKGGLEAYLDKNTRKENRGKVVRKFLRPGLEEWLERLVSRALIMSVLKPCLEKDHWGVGQGRWHKHGGTDFFSP